MEGNLIETFRRKDYSQFIDDINLANNPIQNLPEEHNMRSSIRFYINPLLSQFDKVTSYKDKRNRQNNEYHLSKGNPIVEALVKEGSEMAEDLEDGDQIEGEGDEVEEEKYPSIQE